jgi:hypothetical protein
MHQQMRVGRRLRQQVAAERQQRLIMPGSSSITSWKRSSSFSCSPKRPNACGTGHSGSRIDSTWLTPVSQWPASSSRPQMLIRKGAMLFNVQVSRCRRGLIL